MTTSTINPWNALFAEVERVYAETAKVLREAEGLLDHAGFVRPEGENAIESQLSASLSKPSWWFPGWVARLYVPRSKSATQQLLYVGVYLHNRKGDDLGKLDEAAIGGGAWRFTNAPPKSYPAWLAKGWAWRPKGEPYGSIANRSITDPHYAARGRCVGVRLSTVTSPESLHEHIITPLVEIANDAKW